jgi:hypothetical protein
VLTFHGDDSRNVNYPEEMTGEVIATMNCGGLPLSVLPLKIGAPVMLLRNLYPLHGLCNGTRMAILRVTILHASNPMPGGVAEWWKLRWREATEQS